MKNLLSGLSLILGVAMFAFGSHLNPAPPAELGRFVGEGLQNGSIWIVFCGGVLATFGAVTFLNPRVAATSGQHDGAS